MTDLKTLRVWFLAASLLLPAAALAGDEDAPAESEPPADEGDSADEAPAEGSKEAAEAARAKSEDGSKEAAEAAADAVEGAADAVEGAADAVEGAAEAAGEASDDAAEQAAEGVEEAIEAAAAVAGGAVEAAAPVPAESEEAENKPKVVLSVEAGAIWLAGNTKSINANGGVNFGVAHLGNKFTLDFAGSYGRGVVAGSGSDEWVEIAKKVGGALRYDRFLIPDVNSIYLGGGALHDPLAGYLVQARGDVGYSHQLVKNDKHSLVVEGGFNYTRDEFMPVAEGGTGGGQNFVGGRIAGAYALNVNDTFGFTQSIETLLGGRENQDAGGPGFDGKLVSDTGLSGALSSFLSVRLGFKLAYDFVPPLKADGTSFEALDTQTSITVVATIM